MFGKLLSTQFKSVRLHYQFRCTYSTNTLKEYYDIVIVGGGLVGATLACTLRKNPVLSDKSILLLEVGKQREWKVPASYTNGVSSLNPGTIDLFKAIDVWQHIEASRRGIVKEMQVWEANSTAVIHFDSYNSDPNIAYIVENILILKGVYAELKKLDGIKIQYESSISDYNLRNQDENSLTMRDGSKILYDLLLGADGWKSIVRKNMGVHYVSFNYNQMGVVATLELEEECDNNIAWQRFLPRGPVAILPLSKKLSSLVWTTSSEHSKKLLTLTDEEFVDSLNKALSNDSRQSDLVETSLDVFDQFLRTLDISSNKQRKLPPKIVKCQENSRAVFPLGFGHASSYISKGVALLGDAAHRVHPLAGQGVNLGFGDVVCMNRILEEAVFCGSRLSNVVYLKKYETERQRHVVPTMLAIHGLQRLYGTDFSPVVLTRSIGLQTVNALRPLKDWVRNHAAQ